MSQYFCYSCAVSGLITPAVPASLTGTAYQLGRFVKHTMPTGTYSVNSIFDDPTYDKYKSYIVTGSVSGFLEIDHLRRKNLIWYAGEQTGAEYRNGIYVAPTNGVKIVLPEDTSRLHAFPIQEQPGLINYCQICGATLPMW